MNRTNLTRAVILCLTLLMMFGTLSAPVFAVNDGLMAYNIYSDPNLSKTSRGFDTFTIDFSSSLTPTSTYWALCNWNMNLNGSKDLYPNASGGGAYAGLQNTIYGDAAIMSFWEISYGNGEILRASRVYPAGKDSVFGGEGEGTNWITSYSWDDDTWYRMVIHCWEDTETGKTFVGQWIQNRETGKWTLISYFNTKLVDSYFSGGMSQFMENYGSQHAAAERDFRYKNMYVFDHSYQRWISLATSTLSYDTWYNNKKGTHEFGATDEYFWGKTNGIVLDDQDAYNAASVARNSYTISQPDTPTFGTLSVENLTLTQTDTQWEIDWDINETGTPQLSYTVELIDLDGNVVFSKTQSRPEVTAVTTDLTEDTALKCRLTVTDVFGNESVAQVKTDAYAAVKPDDDDLTSDTTSDVTSDTTSDTTSDAPSDTTSDGTTSGGSSSDNTTGGNEPSPETGSNDAMYITLATVSLVGTFSASVFYRKKRSRIQ